MSVCYDTSSSSDSDDDAFDGGWWVPASPKPKPTELYEPYDRNQGFFLANLAKMLDDADRINLSMFLRWSPGCEHALEINWPGFIQSYPALHDILVGYKMVRRSNSVISARSSWNRKLREWKFNMQAPNGNQTWTRYTYTSKVFHRGCRYDLLPNKRR